MGWMWIIAAAWVLLGIGLALVIAGSVALADRKAADAAASEPPNSALGRPAVGLLPGNAGDAATSGTAAGGDGSPITHLSTRRGTAWRGARRPPVLHFSRHRPRRRSGLG